MSSLRAAFYVSITISVIALVFGVLSTVLLLNGGIGTNTNTTVFVPTTGVIDPLALYSDRAQPVNGANLWTNVVFNEQLFASGGAWLHTPGTATIVANRTGLFSVYFGIQGQLNTTTAPVDTPLACKPCYMRFMIRALQERDGVEEVIISEVPGSLAYASGESLSLTKSFYIAANEGDIFRFQCLSSCGDFVLYPQPFLQPSLPSPTTDSFPTSAVLLIS